MAVCDRCVKHVDHVTLVLGSREWLCSNCDPLHSKLGWTTDEKIKSRTLMADGTVLTGMAGIRARSEKLKTQSAKS